MKQLICAVLLVGGVLWPATAKAQMIILTRHAERADAGTPSAGAAMTSSNDPLLSEVGKARAAKLAAMLKDAGLVAVYTTEYKRTIDTGAPIAAAANVTPKVIPARDAAALLAAIKSHTTGTILIVGHSNTVPEIIKALGGPAVTIDDADYDNVFFLGPGGALTRIRFKP